MNSQFVPQAQPLAQYLALREPIDAAIHRVLLRGQYMLGEECQGIEREWASFLGVDHAIGVASGTDALSLTLRGYGIGRGDEVITTPHTAVATVAAIELAGAVPVLADIERDTCLLDPVRVEEKISPRTRAIIAVHLFGQPASLDAFVEIARRNRLRLIEDCAQAHGARFRGTRVGTWGDAGCFSFYPTKNLGAIGDGGMVVTHDGDLAVRIAALREYGWKKRVSQFPGCNSRLDELQSAILRVKLPHLDADNECRIAIARRYTEELSEFVSTPVIRDDRSCVYHQYVVRTPTRDLLQENLLQQEIGTAIHYPIPVHLQPAYRGRLGDTGSFPVAEELAGQILSLPMYPQLTPAQVDRIILAVQRSCALCNAAAQA
jgi:dTDP-4-amino-4,6-dideoxygalactose transaminase